jgi:predicted phosphodiesterase
MVAGDTHGDIAWVGHLSTIAADAGASTVLQVGDFGYWPRMTTAGHHAPHHHELLGRIASDCKAYGIDEWIVIDGNHDDHSELSMLANGGADDEGLVRLGERVRYSPRGNRFMLGGARVGTLGGAVSLDAWAEYEGLCSFGDRGYRKDWDWFPTLEAPTLADVDHLIEGGHLDLLLTHEAPRHVDMSPYYGLQGIHFTPEIMARTAAVRDLVSHAAVATKAPVLVHGHWHRRVTTWVDFPESSCLVESLASNSAGSGRDGRAYLFIDMETQSEDEAVKMRVTDGRDAAVLNV